MAATIKSEQEGSFLVEDSFSANIDLPIEAFQNEEDEIVQEFDVFLSPELANQMHLMQFPLQQAAFSSPDAARIKPQHCMMEVDYSTPENVGEHGGYQIATRSFVSHTIPVGTHMALGKMVNKPGFEGLHLVPLSRITQLRPTFKHVDEATISATATTEEDALNAEAELSSLGRKPLSFQKKESERAAMIRKSTYAYKRMSEESELWQNLNVHDCESMEAKSTMDKVTEGTSQHNLMTLTNPSSAAGPLNDEYIRTLNYLPGRNNEQENDGEVDAAAVVTKLVDLMQEGWPIPYKILKSQFSSSISENMLIEALASCAFLVRGNFVLQSKLLSFSQSIAHARTFVLFLFQTIEVVHRLRLEQVYEDDDEVTSEIILMLLKQVGRSTPEGWKLRVEDDPSFGINHPTAVVVHLSFWTSQLRRFQPLLDLYRQDAT
ncbi:unnamed protein product [Cylindrotheca closterium]|uniref:Uncharacterized protein n=1 Tax=Cylindrotheca closterium TaxID=2856 RepID=A0AAD2JIX6_9STRA|nr:unnamed protein product [Cylindrotheca closterium]